jgi:hypothetical protein
MRGKTISTYVMYEVACRLGELVADANEALDNDLHAWSRTTGHELVTVSRTSPECRYLIRKIQPRRPERPFAAIISNAGLEELLSPLAFALAAALEGVDVSLYLQGPAVRVLSRVSSID